MENGNSKRWKAVRYKSASLAISRSPIYFGPIPSVSKSEIIDFKARAYRQGGRNRLEYKAGLTGSSSRYLQGVQGLISSLIPGDTSKYRSPVRSRLYSAATPSIPGVGGRGGSKPGENRGYRCPEGYQYGGRFTDSRFSTCGKQLFDIPRIIGQSIAQSLRAVSRAVDGREIGGRVVSFGQPSSNIIESRAPQIPKVSKLDNNSLSSSVDSVMSEMFGYEESFVRMVRRDGFVLEPVVSAAVLRTVPDNRDMEGATYISSINKPSSIGTDDDIGLLSNTGIQKLIYVLPDGSSVSLEKSRILTVGERRKLGRSIRSISDIDTSSDPTAKLKAIAAEMGSGIAYKESFKSKNPNDIIDAEIPGTNRTKQMRRWYYEAFVKNNSKRKQTVRTASVSDAQEVQEKISQLDEAVKHLNKNGKINEIKPEIRIDALKKSSMFKESILKSGKTRFDKADGQTVIKIDSKYNYEHIGESISSDIQRLLGLPSPQIIAAGSGPKRPYLIQETNDILPKSSFDRKIQIENANAEDMMRIMVSDYVTDVRSRDISTISSISTPDGNRVLASINRPAGLAGLSPKQASIRNEIEIQNFYSAEYLAMIKSNFEKRARSQREAAIRLLDAMISRLREYDLQEVAQRLALDGEYSQAEIAHIKTVQSLYDIRLKRLAATKKTFLSLFGL